MDNIDLYSHKISIKNNVGYETARDMLQDKVYDLEDDKKSYSNVVKKAFTDVNKKLKKFTGGNVDTIEFPEYLEIESEDQKGGSFLDELRKVQEKKGLKPNNSQIKNENIDMNKENRAINNVNKSPPPVGNKLLSPVGNKPPPPVGISPKKQLSIEQKLEMIESKIDNLQNDINFMNRFEIDSMEKFEKDMDEFENFLKDKDNEEIKKLKENIKNDLVIDAKQLSGLEKSYFDEVIRLIDENDDLKNGKKIGDLLNKLTNLNLDKYFMLSIFNQKGGSNDSFIVNYGLFGGNFDDSDTIKFPEYLDIESDSDQQYGGFDDIKFPEFLEIESESDQ